MIFNYATQYYYSNKLESPEEFVFTDANFKEFLIFIKENKFEYETESEKLFSKAMRKTSEENFKDNIDLSFKQLMTDIDKAKEEMLVAKKEEIVTILSDEILKRYFYREGMYSYHLTHSAEIIKAVSVLKNESLYDKILK